MKENKKKETEKISREEYLYHNTELLLKKYRDVVWSIEVAMTQTELDFELEMDCGLGEFLEMSYVAGADFLGTQIQEQMRTLERNKKMLKIIEKAVDVLKSNPTFGEEYYWILHFTYLSKKVCPTVDEIIENVYGKTHKYMSQKTYFKHRKTAINKLSTILWGFTAKDCSSIIDKFV
ncbi:MAG: hypothetical protein IJN96_01705 [Clostridia bacterium]|nr:hypothetical protein [Clostridia bacterium]